MWRIMAIFLIIIMITFCLAAKVLKRDMEDSVFVFLDEGWSEDYEKEDEDNCWGEDHHCKDCERCKDE